MMLAVQTLAHAQLRTWWSHKSLQTNKIGRSVSLVLMRIPMQGFLKILWLGQLTRIEGAVLCSKVGGQPCVS
jgi:hypothetical protein